MLLASRPAGRPTVPPLLQYPVHQPSGTSSSAIARANEDHECWESSRESPHTHKIPAPSCWLAKGDIWIPARWS